MNTSLLRRGLLAVLIPLCAACGGGDDEAVSHSEMVGINLKAKADDVRNGVVTDEKNVNTESGNPYGAFIDNARAHLGRAPGRIELRSAGLLLGAGTKGVTALEQAVAGQVEVLFVMNDTNNTFPAATVADPKGSGPVPLKVRFDGRAVGAVDYPKLLNGSFKVVLRAPAAAGFAGRKDTEAGLQVNLVFAAYE